jgi:glucose/arabinose dehydrogenase
MPAGLLSRLVRACIVLVVALPVVVVPAGSASAAGASITWTRRATGFVQPTQVTSARDGTGRLFVVEKAGRIRIYVGGRVLATPYLDIRSLVKDAGEGGLFSIAFHPAWKTSPYFWVNYVNNAGDIRVARFKASTYRSNTVSPSTVRTTIDIWHPDQYTNHFGGQLAFGRDRYLYVSTGDGGGAGDPGNRAQDTTSRLGKILRMQVVGASSTCGRAYCIPPTNPYSSSTTAKRAIWAVGLRNPWRMSFDAANGDLWIGDVGQSRQEEVDRIPAGVGGRNLGWSCREGRLVYNASRCRSGTTYAAPSYAYARSYGTTITGGYVYRGTKYRSILGGRYIGGDFGSGRIFYTTSTGIRTAGSLPNVTSFGEGGTREIWAVTYGGGLYRMAARAT